MAPTHPHRARASSAVPASSRAGRRWAGARLGPCSSAAGSTFHAMAVVGAAIAARECQRHASRHSSSMGTPQGGRRACMHVAPAPLKAGEQRERGR